MNLSGGNSSDYKDEHDELKKSLKIMSITINTLVFVFSVLGNGVVIWVTVTGFKMMKTVSTVWYLNLAVADLLLTAFLPLTITETALDDHWPFGKFMCKLKSTVLSINMYASVYIQMFISTNRCVCVVWPVWTMDHCTVRKASCVILSVWVLALALSSPYFIFMDTQPSSRDKDIILCLPTYALTDDYSSPVMQLQTFRLAAMVFTQFLMGFVVPFTVIVSCYSVMIQKIKGKHLSYQLRGKHLSYQFRGKRLSLLRSDGPFKIIVAVITAFFLCWAPCHIMEQVVLWGNFMAAEQSETLDHVIIIGVPIATCLAFLNSCLNPLLYMFIGNLDFKAGFRRSVLKVVVPEELHQTNTSTKPVTCQTALSETQVGFRRSLPKVLVPEELPQTNTSKKPGITCQLTALSETQETLEEHIHETLKELGKKQFKEFKWYLGQRNNLEGLKPLPQDSLEDADKMETTNLIVQAYPQKKVQIVMNVLKKISREDLALRFQGRPFVGVNRSNVSTIMTTSPDVHSEKVHFGRGQRLDESEIPSTST